jgi:hypothetical protein
LTSSVAAGGALEVALPCPNMLGTATAIDPTARNTNLPLKFRLRVTRALIMHDPFLTLAPIFLSTAST